MGVGGVGVLSLVLSTGKDHLVDGRSESGFEASALQYLDIYIYI